MIRYRSTEAYRLLTKKCIGYPGTVAYTVAHPSPGSPTRHSSAGHGGLASPFDTGRLA